MASEELINTPPPGTVLAGKYRVDRVLGHGGMGYVLAATHLHLDEPVAIKFLHAAHAGDSERIARFVREAKAVRKIRSEHVVRVLDVGVLDHGVPYIVMEFLEGSDLDGILRRSGRQAIATAVDFILQTSEALAEAHCQGMVHRDLKPANLFVTKRADGHDLVKVLDFGISKVIDAGGESALTKAGTMLGSPLYMAPEQIRSFSAVDGRTDIWSLAIVLHECLVGRPPFDGDSLPELCGRILDEPAPPIRAKRPDIPEALEQVILRCLAKDPAARFANVAELANALAPFASDFGRQSVATIAGVFATAGIEVPRSSTAPAPIAPVAAPTPTPKTRDRTLFDPTLASQRTPPSATGPFSPVGASTTGKAWGPPRASSPPPITAKKTDDNTAAIAIGAVVAGLAVLGLVGVLVAPAIRARRAEPTASPESAPPPVTVTVTVTASAPPPPPVVDAAVADVPVPDAAPPAIAPAPAPAPVKVDCTEPYVFDATGRKRWKPECVH
ncbi:MAG: serine/threonine protein kinase [Labilithrix sp.]|nr:serine/threonine protein kinase [Labilithrix sp.]MCW5816463.1 serine/threonine protein kinase [Labilithrix sp.]